MSRKILATVGAMALWCVVGPLSAAETDRAAESGRSAWWPQFHGPNRDNMSADKGLLKTWPEGGPRLLWKNSQCGQGFSGVSIADGMIFTTGDFDDEEMVIALSMDGKLLWKSANGKPWTGPYPGSRTTPTYDNGVLYQMNPTGRLGAFRAKTGELLWSKDLVGEFDARYGTWALAENILVDGELVYCVPGGNKGLVAALDKNTGKTVWTAGGLNETAAYCSPILVTYQGVRLLITLTQKSVIGVDVDKGKLLWSHPHVTPHDQNVSAPLFRDGYVLVATGHSAGARLLKIASDLSGITEVWAKKDLDNCHGGVIHIDGRLYGSACRIGGKGFFCADYLTGERIYTENNLGKLSMTSAEGMLYGLSDRGEMLLLAIAPDGLTIAGQFDVPKEDKSKYLMHPVVCGGTLYIRHGPNLYAYDVRDPSRR